MKDKKKLLIGCVIGLIAIIAVILIVVLGERGNRPKEPEGETAVDLAKYKDVTGQVETLENFVKPGAKTLDLDDITGFTQKKNNKNGNSNERKKNKDEKSSDRIITSDKPEKAKIELSDSNLTIESVGSYTGNFVEDGADAPISNVAAIVITNHSKKMLQIADITFTVRDGEVAKFRVTNLLPDSSAIVLEANKREYSKEDDYSYGVVANSYLDTQGLLSKKFDIEKKDGELVLKNKTKKSYKKVYVYYKYAQSGGAYMGGITYRVPFENIDAKGSVTSVANHFSKVTSMIVDVQIAEE